MTFTSTTEFDIAPFLPQPDLTVRLVNMVNPWDHQATGPPGLTVVSLPQCCGRHAPGGFMLELKILKMLERECTRIGYKQVGECW